MQHRRTVTSVFMFGLVFCWMGLADAKNSKNEKSTVSLPELDKKYTDYQKRVENLFLHGTKEKVASAVNELDVRVVECRKGAAVHKLVKSIVAKRFENTTAKQQKALQYYLLVETLKHLKQDFDETMTRTQEIQQLRDKYNANLIALEDRKKKTGKVKQPVGFRRSTVRTDVDDDRFAVEIGETSHLKVKLPLVTPVAMKKAAAVRDIELEGELANQTAREEALRVALTDVETTQKKLRSLNKAIIGSLKKTHRDRVDAFETISQI